MRVETLSDDNIKEIHLLNNKKKSSLHGNSPEHRARVGKRSEVGGDFYWLTRKKLRSDWPTGPPSGMDPQTDRLCSTIFAQDCVELIQNGAN